MLPNAIDSGCSELIGLLHCSHCLINFELDVYISFRLLSNVVPFTFMKLFNHEQQQQQH